MCERRSNLFQLGQGAVTLIFFSRLSEIAYRSLQREIRKLAMIEVPLLGELEEDQVDDWLISKPTKIKALGGESFEFILEGYVEDDSKGEFRQAIENFLSIDESVIMQAQDSIYKYYKDVLVHLVPGDGWYVEIAKPEDVWNHIRFGGEVTVNRRLWGDKAVYLSLACSCDWEREHGLQIVFREGLFVNKIGPFDGHLTNSDAYANESLENVVYRQRS